MRTPIYVFVYSLAIATITGCSSPPGSSGGGSTPKTKEEAISKLSSSHKQNFERWKQQVVKACDASQAFGLGTDRNDESDGIDGTVLLQKNGGSLIFSDQDQFAMVTSTQSFAGVGTTQAEESQQINGQGYTITAETKREGSYCSVYLYGQKVYETYLAKSLVIGTQWHASKEATSTSGTPKIIRLGASGASGLIQSGVFDLISETLTPSKEALTLLTQKLGIKEEQATKFLKLGSIYAGSALRLENEPSAVWSNPGDGNLIAHGETLKRSFDGTNRKVPLEVRLPVPSLNFGDATNVADHGNLKLTIAVSVNQKDATFNYSTATVKVHGLADFDKNEALECSRDRASAYIGSMSDMKQLQPSVQKMLSPCRTLYSEIETATYESGLMKSLIPQLFAGVSPSAYFHYAGWDQVLSRLARETLDQNKDIRSELDPSSETRIVGWIADHLEAVKRELSRTKNLTQSQDQIFQMALNWTFRGEVVPSTRIEQILQAVDNSIEPFQVSSEKLLADLSQRPASNDDQLFFARTLDSAYKTEALKAFRLSKDLDSTDYERDVFNQVIQRKISVDEVKDWTTKLSGIKSEIGNFSNLKALKRDMVSLSIKWLKAGEASVQDLGPIFAAIDNSIIPFEQSTRELINSLARSLSNNREALNFARSLSEEYKQLAVAIRDSSRAAGYESWGQSFFKSILQERPSINQVRAWNEMWGAVLTFNQREKSRTEGEFGSTNEWNRKKVIELAVQESWSNVEFTGLETIAEVARAKNTCERYQGYSSLADCAGMRLFSKQKGMFFDPNFGGRYIRLGSDFATYMKQLSDFNWTTLRWSLLAEFFGSFNPIWSQCDQESFNQKATTLKSQINALVRETDQFQKWELERKVKDTVRNCQ